MFAVKHKKKMSTIEYRVNWVRSFPRPEEILMDGA
jgi:hypothetical protein